MTRSRPAPPLRDVLSFSGVAFGESREHRRQQGRRGATPRLQLAEKLRRCPLYQASSRLSARPVWQDR